MGWPLARRPAFESNGLNSFQRFLERMVEFAELRDAAAQDRFKIGQIGDVDNLIDTVHKRAHGVVGGEAMAEQNDEMFAAKMAGFLSHFAQDRIRFQTGVFEVLVNDDDVVGVGLEFQKHIFLEKAEVHFVVNVDQLRNDDFLILLMIDADERGVIAKIEKLYSRVRNPW